MSIKYNNKTIAGYYKTEIIPNADTVNAGKIRIATQAEVDSGESNSTAVTPSYLSKKQDKLTAGKNITIENGVISADTTTGINVDGETISNENAVLSSIGTKTKSNTIKIDWEGTEAEYEAGLADGTISNDWYCYITDDETVVDFADHTELEVQNMYKTGNVSTDTTGYNQLVEMKHSTFDLSKFKVVGSPNITSDGIASGFSATSVLQFPNTNLQNANTWEIEGVVKAISQGVADEKAWLSPVSGNGIMLPIATNIGSTKVAYQLYLSSTNTSWDIASDNSIKFPSGSIVKCNLKFTGTQYIYTCTNLNTGEVKQIVKNSTLKVYQSPTQLGRKRNVANLKEGELIYLKQFSITVDGKEVFNGNKTGIDTIKADNYEVVGSPVITDDGIASGLDIKNNYIITPFTTSKPFFVEYIFNTGNFDTTADARFLISFESLSSIYLNKNANSFTISYKSNDGTEKYAYLGEAIKNTNYKLSCNFNGANSYYKMQNLDTNKEILTNLPLLTENFNLTGIKHICFNSGSIDLNSFKIYVDGQLVYQPCLKIPYTESKTGSKIVDVAYRDRVIDLYEQEGQAGYYTIDEPNKNFTLPMGEIYGMIGGKSDKDMLNNPYSLFDSKYSDHELNNLSWLKSSGQWNAKAVYTDAYDKLLKVYNGTETVEGLSVKLSTETYTDYDFVLNTAEETFRLPLKNHTADDGKSVLTLYFYVGETVQNANLIDAGRIGEQIATKTDMLQASGAGMPSDKYIDLTLGASGSTYTAPANGYFHVIGNNTNVNSYLLLQNTTKGISSISWLYATAGNMNACYLPVSKNDVFQVVYYEFNPTLFKFIYAEGSK